MAKDEVKVHELKSHPWFFESLLDGTKRFELRKNDRGFKVGDTLLLKEWKPKDEVYTGREVRARVLYLTEDSNFVQPGIVAMSIELF